MLPINIYIEKNRRFFAEVDWILYKIFGKTRTIPCGRTKKDKYLCCNQPLDKNRMYLTEDKKECYCKVCNSTRILSNQPIDLDNIWGEF